MVAIGTTYGAEILLYARYTYPWPPFFPSRRSKDNERTNERTSFNGLLVSSPPYLSFSLSFSSFNGGLSWSRPINFELFRIGTLSSLSLSLSLKVAQSPLWLISRWEYVIYIIIGRVIYLSCLGEDNVTYPRAKIRRDWASFNGREEGRLLEDVFHSFLFFSLTNLLLVTID